MDELVVSELRLRLVDDVMNQNIRCKKKREISNLVTKNLKIRASSIQRTETFSKHINVKVCTTDFTKQTIIHLSLAIPRTVYRFFCTTESCTLSTKIFSRTFDTDLTSTSGSIGGTTKVLGTSINGRRVKTRPIDVPLVNLKNFCPKSKLWMISSALLLFLTSSSKLAVLTID